MSSGYQEALERAAFDERTDRGRVLVSGADAQSFLQALLTNDIAVLTPGTGCYAALLTPQGRMITDMDVLAGGDARVETVLLVVPSDAAAPLAARLDRLIFSEDAAPADISAATAHFSITGPDAAEVTDRVLNALGYDPAAGRLTAPYQNATLSGVNQNGRIWRNDELGADGFDILVSASERDALRRELERAAAPLSRDAREALRVEAGRPEFGVDMTTETIPLEANLLERAISTTKGCYVGQEVIIRVLHRGGGRVAKRLVRLQFEGDAHSVPAHGTTLQADGKDIGRVTSAVWSPRRQAAIGLGYVHRDSAIEGQSLQLPDGARVTITGV